MAWGFDGSGWWLLFQRSSAGPAVMWPVPLAGAGNRDALLFRDGGGTYDLLRLRWRSSTLHTYATAGIWTSGILDGGDPSADKAWRGREQPRPVAVRPIGLEESLFLLGRHLEPPQPDMGHAKALADLSNCQASITWRSCFSWLRSPPLRSG